MGAIRKDSNPTYLAGQMLGMGVDVGRELGPRWIAVVLALAKLPANERPLIVRLLSERQRQRTGALHVSAGRAAREMVDALERRVLTEDDDLTVSRAEFTAASDEIPALVAFMAEVQRLGVGLSRRLEAWKDGEVLALTEDGVLSRTHPGWPQEDQWAGVEACAACGVLGEKDAHVHCQGCSRRGEIGGVVARPVVRIAPLTWHRQNLGLACDACRADVLRAHQPPEDWLYIFREPAGSAELGSHPRDDRNPDSRRVGLCDHMDLAARTAHGVAVIDVGPAHPRIYPADFPDAADAEESVSRK